MGFKLGLCSITFRDLSIEEVIKLAKEAKLDGIEWGSETHAPPGNLDQAKYIRTCSEEAGLKVASYGSYYRPGEYEQNPHDFKTILETAVVLSAPAIRVWAGNKGSAEASEVYREQVVNEIRTIADSAAKENIVINVEFHGNTLTDFKESAATFIKEVNHNNVKLYWQPAVNESVEERLATIDLIKPWLSDVHVFYWHGTKRLPLVEGKLAWEAYLQRLHVDDTERFLYLEFVEGDEPEQFIEDACVLHDLARMGN